jgi:hypothetical protein
MISLRHFPNVISPGTLEPYLDVILVSSDLYMSQVISNIRTIFSIGMSSVLLLRSGLENIRDTHPGADDLNEELKKDLVRRLRYRYCTT